MKQLQKSEYVIFIKKNKKKQKQDSYQWGIQRGEHPLPPPLH